MIKPTKNRSIKQRLIYSSILITLIPMIILEVGFSIHTKNVTFNQTMNSAGELADRLISNYSLEIEKAELMVSSLAEFTPLQTYLYTDFESRQEEFKYYQGTIHPMVSGYNNSKGSTRIRIYHNQDIPNYSLELNNELDDFISRNFEENPFVKGSAFWMQVDCYPFHPVLSYFRIVQDKTSNYNTAYVASVHLKEKAFSSYLAGVEPESTLVLLTDDDGNILTTNDETISGKRIGEVDSEFVISENENGSKKIRFRNQEYYLISRSSKPLYLTVLVSDHMLTKSLRESLSSIVLIGLVFLVLAAVLLAYSTDRITMGIGLLMNKMKDVTKTSIHTLAKDSAVEGSHDEIVQLDSAFTKMMQQIDELVEQVREDEAKLKDEIISRQQAEMTYLQQQINPHYLFNTLEAFRMNMYLKNDLETASMIKMFAESFRRYINITDNVTTLFEETAFIEKFIAIQNYRLGNKITFQLVAKDRDLSTEILKLLIQPIVENSVTHGLEDKAEGGSIVLIIKKTSTQLIIQVVDDGVGLSEDDLKRVRKTIYEDENVSSVALRNVYRRIKLYYGEEANLTIESELGVGSTVTMTIPLRGKKNV